MREKLTYTTRPPKGTCQLFLWLIEAGYDRTFLQLFLTIKPAALNRAMRNPLTTLTVRQLYLICILLSGYKSGKEVARSLKVYRDKEVLTLWQQMSLELLELYEPSAEDQARAFIISKKRKRKRVPGRPRTYRKTGGPELVGQFMTAIEKGEADALDIEEFRKIISGKLSGQQAKDKPKDTGNGTSVKL